MAPSFTIIQGDALEKLRELPSESVQRCVTSPPYWGPRDYGHEKQLGREPTYQEYVDNMVAVFERVRRVLKDISETTNNEPRTIRSKIFPHVRQPARFPTHTAQARRHASRCGGGRRCRVSPAGRT